MKLFNRQTYNLYKLNIDVNASIKQFAKICRYMKEHNIITQDFYITETETFIVVRVAKDNEQEWLRFLKRIQKNTLTLVSNKKDK